MNPAKILDVWRRRKTPETLEETSHVPFERQFEKNHVMEVAGKEVTYTHLRPEKLTSKVPVVIAPGLTENKNLLENLLKRLYADGREVYTLRHSTEVYLKEQNGHPIEQEQKIQEVAGLMHEALRQPNGKIKGKVDMLGRSDGGVNATFATLQNPNLVRNILLLDTKYTGPQHGVEFTKQFVEFALQEGVTEVFRHPNRQIQHGIVEGARYVGNGLRIKKEIQALAHSDIRPALIELGERGIGRFGIHGDADKMLSHYRAQQDIIKAGGNQQNPEILAKRGLAKKGIDREGNVIFQKNPDISPEPQRLLDGFLPARGRHHSSVYHDHDYLELISRMLEAADARSKMIANKEAEARREQRMRTRLIGTSYEQTSPDPLPAEQQTA